MGPLYSSQKINLSPFKRESHAQISVAVDHGVVPLLLPLYRLTLHASTELLVNGLERPPFPIMIPTELEATTRTLQQEDPPLDVEEGLTTRGILD
jgi:hypothetical protein